MAEVEVRTMISVELVLTAPFTDLSKGGDTTALVQSEMPKKKKKALSKI